MASDAFESLPAGVSCYGYLDKANQEERNKYYELLKTAKVFINTTALWGAFSAMMEAMYFYVPVITTCYSECARTFGQKIDFGFYAENDSAEALCCRIREILEHPAYTSLCVKAHEAVQGYTWSAFADQMLQKMDRLTSPKRVWTLAATKYEASSINPGSTEVAGLGHPLKSAWATTRQ